MPRESLTEVILIKTQMNLWLNEWMSSWPSLGIYYSLIAFTFTRKKLFCVVNCELKKKKEGKLKYNRGISSVQSLSHVRLFVTPWIAVFQASLSITNSWSSLKLTSIESVMPSSHLILCHPFFLLPPIPPNIRVFSNESTLHMRWPKYWSSSFSIIPSKEHPGLISFRIKWSTSKFF